MIENFDFLIFFAISESTLIDNDWRYVGFSENVKQVRGLLLFKNT